MSINLREQIYSKPPKNGSYYVIAIDGRGGAGKSTLTEYVATLLPNFTIINGDEYFEPDDTTIAFGSFNDERFIKDVINPLQEGKKEFVYHPYDRDATPPTQDKPLRISDGVIIERSFSLGFELDWDLTIWVETPQQLALDRSQERDEMPLEEGLKQWEVIWKPKEDAYFEKVKPLETADIVIDGTKSFSEQVT